MWRYRRLYTYYKYMPGTRVKWCTLIEKGGRKVYGEGTIKECTVVLGMPGYTVHLDSGTPLVILERSMYQVVPKKAARRCTEEVSIVWSEGN